MKKVLVILGVFFVVGVIAGLVASGTRLWAALMAPAKAADAFFAVIAKGDHATAVELLAPELRAVTSPEQLAADIDALGVRGSHVTWRKWHRDLSNASLVGKAETATGEVVLAVRMAKEGAAWRLATVQKVDPADTDKPLLPTAEEQARLARATRVGLFTTLREKDFAPLMRFVYTGPGNAVAEFQRGITEWPIERLQTLERLAPTLVPATAVDARGGFELKSVYPTRPEVSWLTIGYLYQGLGWRVVGISASVPPAPSVRRPTAGKPPREMPARAAKRVQMPVEIAKI